MSSSNGECSSKPSSKNAKGPKRTTVQHQQLPPRPKLVPTYPSAEVRRRPSSAPRSTSDDEQNSGDTFLPFSLSGLPPTTSDSLEGWTSVITSPAYAPLQSWLNVMQSLIRHPERNSSNILRADVVDETAAETSSNEGGWKKQWTIRRVLLPRRPNLDWRMEQDCSLFYQLRSGGVTGEHDGEEVEEAVVVYTPLVGDVSHPKMSIPPTGSGGKAVMGQPPPTEDYIPFYHPKVRALAFHYQPFLHPSSDPNSDTIHGSLSISLIPFSPTTTFPPTHRLTRVALSLLTTLHMHTWGDLHSYQKRVNHDQILPRSLYQDLYLRLKTKYASDLIAGWREATDPAKHVFEEMGIAAYCIGLWRIQYGEEGEGWKEKVKFVDVGCGNGLLSHILAKEGFKGVGLDMRARKSWAHYTEQGTVLREWTFDPATIPESNEEWQNAWLLGNHADQLTPWIPLLATHLDAAGFINLPCCYYALDGTRDFPLLLKADKGESLSRNEQYLAYVSHLHQWFGWQVELDPLRIPSTKNWCFVGRRRDPSEGDAALKMRLRDAISQSLHGAWSQPQPITDH